MKPLKTIMTAIIPFIFTMSMIIYLDIHMKNTIITIMISLYITIMGIQLFLSIMRISEFQEESLLPQALGILGTIFFTLSDTLLFLNIFLTPIPHLNIISLNFYWIGMYILMISVVRNKYNEFT